MLKDLRHGARMLLQAKGWTAVVVLSLALGIGANTALFSAVNGLLLTKLPVADPDTLVRLRWAGKNDMVTDSSDYGFSAKDAAGQRRPQHVLLPDVPAVRRRQPTMDDLVGVRAVRPRQRRRRRPGRHRDRVHLVRQLLPRARRARRVPAARSCRTTISPTRAAGRRDQRAVLALAVRQRSRRRRQGRARQQRPGHDRRRACRRSSPACSRRCAKAPDIAVPLALDPQFDRHAGRSGRTAARC